MIKRKNYSISIIRVIAMSMIVTTHILQSLNNKFAWELNVGVSIFLFMSGFLFGNKNISNFKDWIKKRLFLILIPYYIYIAIIIPVFYIYGNGILRFNNILAYITNLQAFFGNVLGLGHLWFITIIIICYLITPLLQKFKIEKINNDLRLLLLLLVSIIIIQFITAPFSIRYYIPNFASYILGYFLSKRYFKKDFEINEDYNFNLIYKVLILLTTILNILKVYLIYIKKTPDSGIMIILVKVISKYSQTFLGSILFLGGFILLEKYNFENNIIKILRKPLLFLDKISYDIYLTHHVFILSPFSLLFLTKNIMLNIVIIIIVTIFSSLLLNIISSNLYKKIK